MPAGNDKDAAYRELLDRYPAGHTNVETVIKANRKRWPRELRRALKGPIDEEATEKLDKAKVAKAAGVRADSIVDATVRGDYVVFSYRDGDPPRLEKSALRRKSVAAQSSSRSSGSKSSRQRSKSSRKQSK